MTVKLQVFMLKLAVCVFKTFLLFKLYVLHCLISCLGNEICTLERLERQTYILKPHAAILNANGNNFS